MKAYLYIIVLMLAVACTPHNNPTRPATQQVDSVYTTADFRADADFCNSGHPVYGTDLLSEGVV